jgi:hypothetical protein
MGCRELSVIEMRGWSGAVVSFHELARYCRNERRGWVVVDRQTLSENTKIGTGGMAIEIYRELLLTSRRERRGGASSSCQKMVEMMGESGAVMCYDALQGNVRNEGRGGSDATYRELQGSAIDEGRGRGCR